MRILIVDDDFLVRSNLKRLIETSSMCRKRGFSIVGEATDGEQAVQLILSLRPDLVISDIRMPNMDGLELQEAILEKYPNILLVMLSGYDELDYVRKALKNGAVDYILKHELNTSVLEQMLSSVEKQMQRTHVLEDNSADSQMALKRNFMMKLISGGFRSEEEIASHAEVLELKLGLRNISVILMQVEPRKCNMIASYLLENSILNIVDEVLQDYHAGICCHVSDDKYVFLICYDGINSSLMRLEKCHEVFARIRTCLQSYLNLSVEFYMGQTVTTAVQVTNSYLSAEQKYDSRFFSDTVSLEEISQPFDIFSVFDAAREKQLVASIRQNYSVQTQEILKEVFEELSRMRPTSDMFKNFMLDLLSILSRAWIERGIDLSKFYQSEEPQRVFNSFRNLNMALKWFKNLNVLAFEGADKKKCPDSPYVEQAIGLIRRHYAEDISQTYVAELIGISAAYLSRLFREDLDTGFADYLCSYRIEKAKELLNTGGYSNKDVSRLSGFHDDAYFARAFKRCTGMTPKLYRKTQKQV